MNIWGDICQCFASTKVGHNITKDYKLSINERLKAIIIWLLAKGKCLLQPPSYSKNILRQLHTEGCTNKQSQKCFSLGWGGFWLAWKTLNRMETHLPNKLWHSEYWTCDGGWHYQTDTIFLVFPWHAATWLVAITIDMCVPCVRRPKYSFASSMKKISKYFTKPNPSIKLPRCQCEGLFCLQFAPFTSTFYYSHVSVWCL